MGLAYIIDGYYYLYSSFLASNLQLTSPKGEPTTATHIFTGEILNLIRHEKPDMLAVTLDSPAKTFRKEIYTHYKGTRPDGMPPDLQIQVARMIDILEAFNIPVYRMDGYEADDIIGTLAKKLVNAGHQVRICTKDKDMCQLVGPNVSIYEMKSKKELTVLGVYEKYGLKPNQFVDFLALQGDASDNIPGVYGIGAKGALKLIQEYGTLESLYNNVWQIKGKLREKLVAGKSNALLSQKLATIERNVPIEVKIEDMVWTIPNFAKLIPLFEELGFEKHLNTIYSTWRM